MKHPECDLSVTLQCVASTKIIAIHDPIDSYRYKFGKPTIWGMGQLVAVYDDGVIHRPYGYVPPPLNGVKSEQMSGCFGVSCDLVDVHDAYASVLWAARLKIGLRQHRSIKRDMNKIDNETMERLADVLSKKTAGWIQMNPRRAARWNYGASKGQTMAAPWQRPPRSTCPWARASSKSRIRGWSVRCPAQTLGMVS